jgi:hypothetical protein
MEDENKDLMAELQAITDKEASRLESKESKEQTAVFDGLLKAFDTDRTNTEAILAVINIVSREQALEELKGKSAKQILRNDVDLDDPDLQGGRVTIVTETLKAKQFMNMLQDFETSIVLSAWRKPAGLVSRVIIDNSVLQVMAFADKLSYRKTLPSGDSVTKHWNVNNDEAPEREHFDTEYEFDLVKSTYVHLTQPMMFKAESPLMYAETSAMILRRISKEINEGGRKHPFDNED